ncbi:MAG TPA: collagen-binding domain-containing protein, partial [Streptosporangiaceae bacterium]|nr:collagen-binding domain-containing protein [Streptosporangiaceae bacterium]
MTGSLGFNVFVGGNTTLNSTSIGGPVALGGNLTLGTSSFNVASQNGGTFTASGDAHPTGLLVGGNVNWASGGSNSAVNVQSNDYVKIGDMTGSAVLTNGNTHVLPSGHSFDSHPQIAEVVNQPTTSVTQSGLIGFASAFSTFRANSTNLASCTGTVVLADASGTALPATLPPNTNAYVSLTSGVQNVLNITAANLANIKILQFNNNNSPVPTASTPLIINVDTTGVGNNFTWATPPNFNGLQNASAAYILWNFPTVTTLTLSGSSTIPGTIYAPGSTVVETDQNGLNGGVIAGAYTQGGPNGSFNGGQVLPNAFNTTVQSCAAGQVTISKTADVTTATPGSTVHYTITVTNSGSVAYAGATFTDPLSGVIDDATYNGDATATAGSVSFISLNIVWTGDVAVGAVATITYSVTIRSPDPGDGILSNTVTSSAGSNCAAGSTDSRCTATVPVSALTIVKTANATSAVPGQIVAYTITVSNTGHAAYTGATFTDPLSDVLDDATYRGDASATSGTVSFASQNLTWTGALAAGAVATITYSVTVNSTQAGNGVLANTVTSTTAGSDCRSGSKDSRCTATVSLTALTIVKTADVSSAAPGSIVHYTIKVTNTGQTAITGATFTDSLTTVLDDASYNSDVGATAGVASFSSPNVTWTGDLATGASATVTYSVTVRNPNPVTGVLPGNGVLSNTVTSTTAGSNCLSGSADVRCTATVTVASLRIVKSADVSTTSPGSVVHYTITVTSTGQTAYTGATFTDPLGGVLDDASYNGDGAVTPGTAGRVTYTSPNLTWTGNLAVGASATITYSVTVNSPDAGDKTLANTVVSSTPGTNCPAGGTDANCSVAVRDLVPALNIVTSADVSTTTPGSTVHYTITVKNTGDSDYAGATFTDPLAGVLDDATGPTNATGGSGADASTGTATFASQNLTWTGDLAAATASTPGASATITFSVTVNKPDNGDHSLASTVTSPTAGSTCPLTGGPGAGCTTTVLVQQLTISVGTNAPGGTVA